MHKSRFSSLQFQLGLVLLSCLVLPTLVASWLAYSQLSESITTERIKIVGRVAATRHEQLVVLLQRAQGRAEGFLRVMGERCGDQPSRSECWQQEMHSFIRSEGASGAQLDADALLIVGNSAVSAGNFPTFQPQQLAQFSRRISGEERNFLIVATDPAMGMKLAITYPLQIIQSLFVSLPDLGDSGETFLADEQGYFITRARYPVAQGHSHPISALPMRRCLQPENAETLDLDYRDVPIIHGFRFVPEIGGGCIMAHIEQAEAFAPLTRLRQQILISLLLFAGFAMAVALFFSRNIIRPITQLTDTAHRIAAGNLGVQATTLGCNEVVELATSFNAMTAQLVEAQTGLEQRIQERTVSLHESEMRFRSIFENAHTGIVSTDAARNLVDFNEVFRAMVGYEAQTLRQMNVVDFSHPEDLRRETILIDEILAGQREHYRIEKRYMVCGGHTLWVDVSVAVIRDGEGQVLHFVAVVHDITTRRTAEDKLNLMAKVFTSSGEGIVITDAENAIVAVNDAFTRLTGYSAADVLGQNPRILSAGRTSIEVYEEMWDGLNTRGIWEGELWDRRKSGESYPKWTSISAVRNPEGRLTHYIGSFTDITARKASEEKILYLAHHDALTQLPNRLHLQQHLLQSISFAKRHMKRMAVLLIDLDHFKVINDTLGHQVGDLLLIEVAGRLVSAVRETDIVARLGGDEFVVTISEIDSPDDVALVADKINQVISAPYRVAGEELRTTPSIGICLYPDDAEEIGDLLKNADVAMYHAKSRGRGNYQFFREEMNVLAARRMAIEGELRTALANQQFVLHYQPQLDLRTGSLTGVEALVRWLHPVRGMVSPMEFIPVTEEIGLIGPLGDWILCEACRQLKEWRSEGLTHIRMSVNLSASQFQDAKLPERIRAILDKEGLSPEMLDLEVTESMSMQSPADAIAIMEALTEHGMSLSIDDFGTGYSSLAYLKLFPISTLKIDRSFVMDIETDPNDADICDVTVLLAHKLGLEVVAEGVETEAQLKFLLSIGCEKVQGYLISKPLPADQARDFIRSKLPLPDLGTVDLW